MHLIELAEINSLLSGIELLPAIEAGFEAYSSGKANVPPVGELKLEKGEVHIKYGAIEAQPYYVIKVASGFYGNSKKGLPTGNGCMLLFCQETGVLKCVLLDEGHLTDVRTAVAGAIVAKHFAPENVSRIGIVGTGIQARAQLKYLASVCGTRDVLVWGRSQSRLDEYVRYFDEIEPEMGFRIETTLDLCEVQELCRLIVTTTPSQSPLLKAEFLKPGTHITAVGSDMPEKQELETAILGQADLIAADSINQCQLRGEISHALRDGTVEKHRLVELGNVIGRRAKGRTNQEQISVADLTGVAVQDIQIAAAVFQRFLNS